MNDQFDTLFLAIFKGSFLFWLVCNIVPVLSEALMKALRAVGEVLPFIMPERTGV